MTQEEKELLLKDLCARLSYQVVVSYKNSDTGEAYNQILDPMMYSLVQYIPYVGGLVIKPYLRPMSSMTEEERKEFIKCAGYEIEESVNGRHYEYFLKDFCGTPDNPSVNTDGVDWLNSHHFDFRGLIEKGLALEAPKDMYNL